MRVASVLLCTGALVALPAWAQVMEGGRARPLSEASRPLTTPENHVGAGSLTVREGSVGSMRSGGVRDGRTRSMRSGPVSEITVGSVYGSGGLAGAPSIGAASAGAVKKNRGAPLDDRISAPLHEFAPLREQLQAIHPLPAEVEPPPTDLALPDGEYQSTAPEEAARQWLGEAETEEDVAAAGSADLGAADSGSDGADAAAQP